MKSADDIPSTPTWSDGLPRETMYLAAAGAKFRDWLGTLGEKRLAAVLECPGDTRHLVQAMNRALTASYGETRTVAGTAPRAWSLDPEQLRREWLPVEDPDHIVNLLSGDALIVGDCVWQLHLEGRDARCVCHDGVRLPCGAVVFESLIYAGCPVYRHPAAEKGRPADTERKL